MLTTGGAGGTSRRGGQDDNFLGNQGNRRADLQAQHVDVDEANVRSTTERRTAVTRENSPAYGALRACSRRLLLFIEGEIARQGGAVTI